MLWPLPCLMSLGALKRLTAEMLDADPGCADGRSWFSAVADDTAGGIAVRADRVRAGFNKSRYRRFCR
ncbi:MAG: hypothetical protein CM1200mP29_07590 [Verrucomicrobiota bacterium]|nr:MAG: hypothetical protein CM1200mP29_07590 [Verrucomicrobiota bacterium]